MPLNILLINGPNLNLLGTRQPEIYGRETLADIEAACQERASTLGMGLEVFQANGEGAIIDRIHAAKGKADAIIINAGAYSHTSIAIMDALASVEIPVYEVHLSNIHARETFRHNSYISSIAKSLICGMGSFGYLASLDFIARQNT